METLEDKIENALYFFHRIYSDYSNEQFLELITLFFKEKIYRQKIHHIAYFYIGVFNLEAPLYTGTEEDELNYIILPAQLLIEFEKNEINIDKILGSLLQINQEGHLSFQLSLILDYLLNHGYLNHKKLTSILCKIIANEYASVFKVGSLLGKLVEINIVEVNDMIEIIQNLRSRLELDISDTAALIIGINRTTLSNLIEVKLIKEILNIEEPELSLSNDRTVNDKVLVMALIFSNYFYEHQPISHIIQHFLSTGLTMFISEAFRYMIENSTINYGGLGRLFYNEIKKRTISFKKLPQLISNNFSLYEIGKILISIFNKDSSLITQENFIELLSSFSNDKNHHLEKRILKDLLEIIQKLEPSLLKKLNIKKIHNLLENYNISNKKKF